MLARLMRFLSADDLLSVFGYATLITVSRLSKHPMDWYAASVLAAGMLALLWLASGNLRTRNRERHPNARVAFWAFVAAASALLTQL